MHLKKFAREGTTISPISQGQEPESFTSVFPSWNPDFWDTLTSYDDIKAQIAEENSALHF
jgi:gelsolin